MVEYKKIPTSLEVWAVIHARHRNDLIVFRSYSAPDGDFYGNPEEGQMLTEYGFKGSDYPLLGALTTWEIPDNKKNDEYWLCCPILERD